VGVILDLLPEDTLGPLRHDVIAGFVKGVPLDALFRDLHARAASTDKSRSLPGHLSCAPLNVITPLSTTSAQFNIATGAALTNKVKNNGKIVVAFSEAAAAARGFWQEALNFAGSQNLPILFVCQNNLWSEPESRKTQAQDEDIASKAQAYGFPGIAVDGNDVVAVYRVACEAVAHARLGHGPTLIECKTYRTHGRRKPGANESEKPFDPILNMEQYLTGKGLFSESYKQKVSAEFSLELDAAERQPDSEDTGARSNLYSFSNRTTPSKRATPKH
jgi:TPP-dependent pyruvate/acetoin dehydrogenase alpha subunit